MRSLTVSMSPHIASPDNTKRIMLDVIIALCCPLIAGIVIYGFYPLFLTLLSVGSAVLTEFLFNKIRKKENTIGDLSAVVTGMILAMCLPPVVPFYVPIVGAVFAVAVVKMLFGGIGRNFANPAGAARIFLMLSWTGVMTAYAAPIDYSQGFGAMFEYFKYAVSIDISAITTATPLATITSATIPADSIIRNTDNLKLFLGNIGGCIGEVSVIPILVAGAYLTIRKVIDWKIPVVMIATVALFALIFYQDPAFILPSILSGGVMFGAVFMATDYATSPNTFWGTIIFAFGIGLLTMIIRKFASSTEGVALSIVLMNIVSPLLDKYIKPRPFGLKKEPKPKKDKKAKEGA